MLVAYFNSTLMAFGRRPAFAPNETGEIGAWHLLKGIGASGWTFLEQRIATIGQ